MPSTAESSAPPARGMQAAVAQLKQQLLDISKRNRLLNATVSTSSTKQLVIHDELPDELYRILCVEGKRMAFEPSDVELESETDEGLDEIMLPTDMPGAGTAPSVRHADLKLGTRHTAKVLQARLLRLYREARTAEEELGVSILFLAMGYLKWYESEASETERFAPLILLPVDLDRDSARGRFKLQFRDQDIEANQSLAAMLDNDFGLKLPEFPADSDWVPSDYYRAVGQAVASMHRWEVQPRLINLSFFSFAKFLMWRDLSAEEEWADGQGLEGHPLAERLLVGGDSSSASVISSDENLDQRFADPKDLGHILEADASQTQVIAAACSGRNLVVQGPPGTGKSQTIANIIAASVRDGKRVLFVAEKRAALDVVHDRLEQCGLGPLCLELHSHKANRKHVYQDLKDTLSLNRPKEVNESLIAELRSVRDELNSSSQLLHQIDAPTGDTPFGIIGALSDFVEESFPRPDFRIEGSESWDREEVRERVEAVSSLADLTSRFGREERHPWRGATRRLNPIERQRLADGVHLASRLIADLQSGAEAAARAASLPGELSLKFAGDLLSQLDALARVPDLVGELLASPSVVRNPLPAEALCEGIARLQVLESELLREVIPSALEGGWDQVRVEIAARGTSLFRWFSGSYRSALARLRGVACGMPPKSHRERLALLDRLLEHRSQTGSVEAAARTGQLLLGTRWQGAKTDVSELLPAVRWIVAQTGSLGSGEAAKRQFESAGPTEQIEQLSEKLRADRSAWLGAWESVAEAVGLDVGIAFRVSTIDEAPLSEIRSRLGAWSSTLDSYESWHRLGTAGGHVSELGLQEVRDRLSDGRLVPDSAVRTLQFVRAEAVWNRMCREEPRLASMDGETRSALVAKFKELDRDLQGLAAQQIALEHHQALPSGSSGQVGIVRGEAAKKIRHMPIRKLLDKAGEAVAAIKPVFLMSPLSVAQYLRPGGLAFDILLIDEASQVRPSDAMGAILRARQVVVVGDQHQMPPTSFFSRQIQGDDDEADLEDVEEIQAAQLGHMESILALCEARALPSGMLRWHYRSKHPSLIQVSNHEFYNDSLICPPSPDRAGRESGLVFRHVDGRYRRGRKRDNPLEAEAVAQAVLVHARERPEEPLGVVALSISQRNAILNKLEWLRGEHPELEAFCKEGRPTPFFVKNLETVQGDERDVILISIGYGKDEGGYMAQSFGPISKDGGERRLNVLFTRAKRLCEVFSSIRHGDIRLDATKHRGPRVLKRFLKYAETGELDIPVLTGGEPDSPFEAAVARALQSHGYRVAGQVGSSGFLIDLAVYDPDDEGRFLLAIECDGARYHSSSWARERDRLRQVVLEGKGWKFHRIWSTDWFYNREVELRKLLAAIERARTAPSAAPDPAEERQPPGIVRDEAPSAADEGPARSTPYVEASFAIPERDSLGIHEVPAARIGDYVVRVVECEGPVHQREVARRVARLWGYKRLGSKIGSAVEFGIRHAVQKKQIRYASAESEDFLDRPDASERETVRNRRDASSAMRDIAVLPPTELRAGVLQAVRASISVRPEECARDVARMLGFRSTSPRLRKVLVEQARWLVANGRLVEVRGELRLP